MRLIFETVVFETDLETANNAKLALTGIPMSPEQFELWTAGTQLSRLDQLRPIPRPSLVTASKKPLMIFCMCENFSVPTMPSITLGAPTASISHLSAPRLIQKLL